MRRQLRCGPGTSGTGFSSAWNTGWSEPVEMHPNCPLPPWSNALNAIANLEITRAVRSYWLVPKTAPMASLHTNASQTVRLQVAGNEKRVCQSKLSPRRLPATLEPLSLRVWAPIMRFSTARAGHRTALRVVWYRPYRVVLFGFIVAVGVTRLTTRLSPTDNRRAGESGQALNARLPVSNFLLRIGSRDALAGAQCLVQHLLPGVECLSWTFLKPFELVGNSNGGTKG